MNVWLLVCTVWLVTLLTSLLLFPKNLLHFAISSLHLSNVIYAYLTVSIPFIHSASISLNFHLDLHMWILSEPYTSPNIPQWFLSFLCSNNAVIQLIHYLYNPLVTSLQTGSWLPHFCHSSFACHTILGFVGIGYTIWCLLTLSILSMYRLR